MRQSTPVIDCSESFVTVAEWPAKSSPLAALPLAAARRSGPADPTKGARIRPPAVRRPWLRRHHGRRGGRARRRLARDDLPLARRQARPARRRHGHHRTPRLGGRRRPVVAHGRPTAHRRRAAGEDGRVQLPDPRPDPPDARHHPRRRRQGGVRRRPRKAIAEGAVDQPDRTHRPLPRRRAPRRTVDTPRPGERFCALASPELYHLLTVELSWTAEHHQQWLTQLVRSELLE